MRFEYEIIRETPVSPPIKEVVVHLGKEEIASIYFALRDKFPEFVDDLTTTTGMFAHIYEETKNATKYR